MGSNSLQCLVQHAMGDLNGASTSADVAQALADHTDQRRAGQGQQRDAEIPSALQRIGALRLALVRQPCADDAFLDQRQGSKPRSHSQPGAHRGEQAVYFPCKGSAEAVHLHAQGDYEEATSLFGRAAAGAARALPADGSSSPGARLEPSPWALREAAASAVSGPGQASLAQKQWVTAEESLSEVRVPTTRYCRHICALSFWNIWMCWRGLLEPEAAGSC